MTFPIRKWSCDETVFSSLVHTHSDIDMRHKIVKSDKQQ